MRLLRLLRLESLEKKTTRGEEEEEEKERKKDAAREQGSGPPEERVGKDTGIKKVHRCRRRRFVGERRAFSLSFSFLF